MSTNQRNQFFSAILTGAMANQSFKGKPAASTMRHLWKLADMAVYHGEHRESPRDIALRWLGKNYVIIDTETTGLGDDAQIVEIAIIDLKGNVLIDTLIKPTIDIPEEATAIHGITNEMVSDSPSWLDVLPDVVNSMGDRWIAYNAEFDKKMIKQVSGGLLDTEFLKVLNPFCAMKLYAEFNGEWDVYRRQYKWKKLVDAATTLNVWPEVTDNDTPHRALFDCRLTLRVIHAIAGVEL
jgi:DNA polymerase III, epsilon subunit and related 3''-5'' exonucleases